MSTEERETHYSSLPVDASTILQWRDPQRYVIHVIAQRLKDGQFYEAKFTDAFLHDVNIEQVRGWFTGQGMLGEARLCPEVRVLHAYAVETGKAQLVNLLVNLVYEGLREEDTRGIS